MYYEVIGWVNNERHGLGFTDDKHDAIEWAWFCMFNRGYNSCDIIDDDGVVVAHYEKRI